MPLETQITFRNLDSSDAVRQQVEDRAAELEQVFDRIVACKVVIETNNHVHRPPKQFHVSVHLTLPGSEVVVNRDPAKHHFHEDVRLAVKDAFDAARRQLEDHVRKLREAAKVHSLRGAVL